MKERLDDSTLHDSLTLLGQAHSFATKDIECFSAVPGVGVVDIFTSEITAHCPKTHQPDFYRINVSYQPDKRCIESKAFKLYLMSFRDEGHFIEAFAQIILEDLVNACSPVWMTVELEMTPRGGIGIKVKTKFIDVEKSKAR